MNAYLIIIGDEILSGRTQDTNSHYIAKKLDQIGISVNTINIIHDNYEVILEELKKAFQSHADFIFTTGGLGPTLDDKTKKTIAEFLDDELIYHIPTLEFLTDLLQKRGLEMNPLIKDQALVPSNSKVIINQYGTAPILWTKKDGKILINLPGVPYETEGMISEYIIPKIKKEYKLPYIIHRSVMVIGMPESKLAIALSKWENQLPSNLSLAYLPSSSQVELRLTAKGSNKDTLSANIENELEKLPPLLGDNLVSLKNENILEIIKNALIKNHLSLSVAESFTGGLLSHKFVSIAGSSAFYKGGIVSYMTNIKEKILEVPSTLIEEKTTVSPEVSEKMAINSAKLFNSSISLASTGVAGPDPDEFNNPIGLAYISLFYENKIFTKKYFYPNKTREEFIQIITNKAIELLYQKITNKK